MHLSVTYSGSSGLPRDGYARDQRGRLKRCHRGWLARLTIGEADVGSQRSALKPRGAGRQRQHAAESPSMAIDMVGTPILSTPAFAPAHLLISTTCAAPLMFR